VDATTVALAAIAFGFVAGAGFVAVALPQFTSFDEVAHVDYAWRVWHGALPSYFDGVRLPLDVYRPPVQWVAQHPPLFYLLLAPLIGPLVDAGHGLGAVQLARIVNIAIGALAVMAVAWATGEVVTGPSRRRWMLAAAAIVAPFGALVSTSAAVYNDALATALGALLLGIGARALRRGVDLRLTAAAALTAGAAALTRVALLPTVAVTVGALAIGEIVHRRATLGPAFRRIALQAAVVVGAVAAIAGWFYLRNRERTGSFVGYQDDVGTLVATRPHRAVLDLVSSGWVWRRMFGFMLTGPAASQTGDLVHDRLPLLAVVAVGVSAIVFVVRRARTSTAIDRLVVAMLAGQLFLTVAQNIVNLAHGGSVDNRYFLPSLLPLGLLGAAGLVGHAWARGVTVLAWWCVGWWFVIDRAVAVLRARLHIQGRFLVVLRLGAERGGLPSALVPLSLASLLAATVLLAWGLWAAPSLAEAREDEDQPSFDEELDDGLLGPDDQLASLDADIAMQTRSDGSSPAAVSSATSARNSGPTSASGTTSNPTLA
jgi:hypothetical protein